MSADAAKVTTSRLRRDAYLYIRQSTLYQVANNTESTTRQYDLRGRAVALGWPAERIHIIDIDQGQSGAHAADREGFQHLVAEVSMGRAGIVLGLECSRLARNNADWQRLLEICAHTDTLICDEDGLYDPTDFNDRLLLGLKGTMAESELHFLRSRLRGGILAKARRGQLRLALPIGLVHDARGEVVLDPDTGVRHAVQLLFDTFTATGSAFTTVKTFRDQQLTFPGRHRGGPHAGQLYWKPLTHSKVLNLLHNPAYAGAYAYGRARHTVDLDGQHHTLTKPIDEWTVLIHGHHPGYITWERFQANQSALAANAVAHGGDRKAGPPREGNALLQGLVLCGRCGRRMTVRYHSRTDTTLVPEYVCQNDGINNAHPICQHMQGHTIDAAVADLALQTLTPLALEVALCVSDELTARAAQADQIRATHIQRAQHAADAVTWPSTPPTGSSPKPSKPTGTTNSVNSPTRKTTTTAPRTTPTNSTRRNGNACVLWPPTYPCSGTTRPPPSANANASSAYSSPTSPSTGAPTTSPQACAYPAVNTTPSPSPSPWPAGTRHEPPRPPWPC
jgi:DNA invertase Pin-like site-specific DNA recombinase